LSGSTGTLSTSPPSKQALPPGHRDVQVGERFEPRERRGVEHLVEQIAIHRADRAQRAACAPAADIEILVLRPACGEHQFSHARADAEHRIDAGERPGAHADAERWRKFQPVGERLVEPALPVAAVAAAGERNGVEHRSPGAIP
jgi:hypothetical protein